MRYHALLLLSWYLVTCFGLAKAPGCGSLGCATIPPAVEVEVEVEVLDLEHK
jgi:hypothetical protein